jgi:hypothetical protein
LQEALELIVDFDHLDNKKFDQIFKYIKSQDLFNFELIFIQKTTVKYTASVVLHWPVEHNEKIIYRLRLKDNKSGMIGEIPIGTIKSAPYYCFYKIVIVKGNLEIRGRSGFYANFYRTIDGEIKNKYSFSIEEIFNY